MMPICFCAIALPSALPEPGAAVLAAKAAADGKEMA